MPTEQIINPSELTSAKKVLNFLAEMGLPDALIAGPESMETLASQHSRGHLQIYTAQPQHKGPLAVALLHAKGSPFREWTVSEGAATVSWNNMALRIAFENPATHTEQAVVEKHGVAVKLARNGRDVLMLCTQEHAHRREETLPYKLF